MSALNSADRRTRQRVVEAAFLLLAQRGLTGELLKDAAERANCPLDRAQIFFRRDEDLVLALYARLAADLEARVGELPEGDVATRFRKAASLLTDPAEKKKAEDRANDADAAAAAGDKK